MNAFTEWLQKGLGRPAIYLKTHDGHALREALLHACTHNLTYDRQCEESRAAYLLDLIELSSDTEFYRNGILEALNSNNDEQDQGQIFEVAAIFAEKDDSEIKQSMYAAFERDGFELTSAGELVRVDGLAGLQFVARSFGAEDPEERPWQFGNLLEILEKHHGKQTLPPELDPFWREWWEREELWARERQKPPALRPDYETVKRSLKRLGRAWAQNASIEQLELAADDLLAESDTEHLLGYLQMFQFRQFPKAIDRLLELASAEDDRIARAALLALSHIQDQRVRALEPDLIGEAKRCGHAVKLLTLNSQNGDYHIIERLLKKRIDPDDCHRLGLGVRRFVEAHRSHEAETSLLLLYENGLCSLCRHRAMKELIAIDRFPDWMRDECQYDAYSETHKLMKSPT